MDELLVGTYVTIEGEDFSFVIEDEKAFKKFRALKNRLGLFKGEPADPSVNSCCTAFIANGAEIAAILEKQKCEVKVHEEGDFKQVLPASEAAKFFKAGEDYYFDLVSPFEFYF